MTDSTNPGTKTEIAITQEQFRALQAFANFINKFLSLCPESTAEMYEKKEHVDVTAGGIEELRAQLNAVYPDAEVRACLEGTMERGSIKFKLISVDELVDGLWNYISERQAVQGSSPEGRAEAVRGLEERQEFMRKMQELRACVFACELVAGESLYNWFGNKAEYDKWWKECQAKSEAIFGVPPEGVIASLAISLAVEPRSESNVPKDEDLKKLREMLGGLGEEMEKYIKDLPRLRQAYIGRQAERT